MIPCCPQRGYLVALYPEKSGANLKDALFSVKLQRFIVHGDGKEQEAGVWKGMFWLYD